MNIFTDPAFHPLVYPRDDSMAPHGGASWEVVAIMLGVLVLVLALILIAARRMER